MSIKVMTPDHGEFEFKRADEWNTDGDGQDVELGTLLIGREEDDTWMAEFAPGAWLFVYTVVEPVEESKPRVWESIRDVPRDVRVVDEDGDVWHYFDGSMGTGWGFTGRPAACSLDQFAGPFIEVVE